MFKDVRTDDEILTPGRNRREAVRIKVSNDVRAREGRAPKLWKQIVVPIRIPAVDVPNSDVRRARERLMARAEVKSTSDKVGRKASARGWRFHERARLVLTLGMADAGRQRLRRLRFATLGGQG